MVICTPRGCGAITTAICLHVTAMATISLASKTTSCSSVLPKTDSDVGMLSVLSESESSGTESIVSGPGVEQVLLRVSLLDLLRTPQRSNLTRKCAIRRDMSVAQTERVQEMNLLLRQSQVCHTVS